MPGSLSASDSESVPGSLSASDSELMYASLSVPDDRSTPESLRVPGGPGGLYASDGAGRALERAFASSSTFFTSAVIKVSIPTAFTLSSFCSSFSLPVRALRLLIDAYVNKDASSLVK